MRVPCRMQSGWGATSCRSFRVRSDELQSIHEGAGCPSLQAAWRSMCRTPHNSFVRGPVGPTISMLSGRTGGSMRRSRGEEDARVRGA